jgi:hypothetical protein
MSTIFSDSPSQDPETGSSPPPHESASPLEPSPVRPIITQNGPRRDEEQPPDSEPELLSDSVEALLDRLPSRPPTRLQLTDPIPPPILSPKKPKPWSPKKSRRRTNSSGISEASLTSLEEHKTRRPPIYLTPVSEFPADRPSLSQPAAYYAFQQKHPFFMFARDGYRMGSTLTNRMIELFRDAETAPEWASQIPDIYAERAAEKRVDLVIDPWVMYWETLIIKEDIRQGCGLAVKAAGLLAVEKGGGRLAKD